MQSTIAERPYYEKNNEANLPVHSSVRTYGHKPNSSHEFSSASSYHVAMSEKNYSSTDLPEHAPYGAKSQYRFTGQKPPHLRNDSHEAGPQNVYSNVKFTSHESASWYYDDAGSCFQANKEAATPTAESHNAPKNIHEPELANSSQQQYYAGPSSAVSMKSNDFIMNTPDSEPVETYPHSLIPKAGYYHSGKTARSSIPYSAHPGAQAAFPVSSYQSSKTNSQLGSNAYSAGYPPQQSTNYASSQATSSPYSNVPSRSHSHNRDAVAGTPFTDKNSAQYQMPASMNPASSGDSGMQMTKRNDTYAQFQNFNVRSQSQGTTLRPQGYYPPNPGHLNLMPRR